MKLKRIMAMVLCVAMVLSTMSFSVFAEEQTDVSVTNVDINEANPDASQDSDEMVIPITEQTVENSINDISDDTEHWYDAEATELIISTVGELQEFALITQGTHQTIEKDSFAGQTVKLGDDIDLKDTHWYYRNTEGTVEADYRIVDFAGTFDGNNKTIKNISLQNEHDSGTSVGLCFFRSVTGAITNLTLDGIDADSVGNATFYAINSTMNNAGGYNTENVHVKNVDVYIDNDECAEDTYSQVAGMIRWHGGNGGSGPECRSKDCSVTNLHATVTGEAAVGGFSVFVAQRSWFDNCDVTDVTFEIGSVEYGAGGFGAQVQSSSYVQRVFNDCDVTNVNITVGYLDAMVGGFLGNLGGMVDCDDCDVTGEITILSDVENAHAGGFVGDLGWQGDWSSDKKGHTFDNCSADVDIAAVNSDVGGFVGMSAIVDDTVLDQDEAFSAVFNDCSASGDVVTENGAAGGFVGSGDRGEYVTCEANGSVKGDIAGGFWGEVFPMPAAPANGNTGKGEAFTGVVLKNNTVSEDVKGTTYEAGLIGYMNISDDGGYTTPTSFVNNSSEAINKPAKTYSVANKSELAEALAEAVDGERILLTADIDYGTDHVTDNTDSKNMGITKAITLDLGGHTLTTRARNYGLALKNDACVVTNGKLNHAGTVAAIKVWNAKEISKLEIDVTGTSASGNTIDGIVIQENAAGVDTIKNVTIHSTSGQGVSSGIKTYNCGNATEDVIGAMDDVDIDAKDVGMNIYAPCGTATDCNIKGGVSGIEIWIKGTYNASLDLVNSSVEGGQQAVYAHDEFSDKPVVNNGTITLTADNDSTFISDGVKLNKVINRITEAQITLPEAIVPVYVARVGNKSYESFAKAVEEANTDEDGATIELLKDITLGEKLEVTGNVTISGEHTIRRAGDYTGTIFEVSADATLTLDGGLVVDGGNAWNYIKDLLEMDMANGDGTYVGDHITSAEGGVNATASLIKNNGKLNANKVTIENSYSTNGVSAIDCGISSETILNGTVMQKIAANRSGAVVYVGGADAVLTIMGETRITGNFGIGNGGIIQNYGQGTTVNMEGGSIDNNHIGKSGTLYASYSGDANKINTFNMSGGIITKNIMEGYGPVYIHTNTVWNMTGGEISENTSFLPNYVRNNNPAGIMSGGKIVNNKITGTDYSNGYYVTHPDLRLNGKTGITGGEFTQDVTEYLAPNNGLVYNEATGTYVLTQELYEYNGVAYKTFSEVIENIKSAPATLADEDKTPVVKVLATHRPSETIAIDTHIVMDLNGKSLLGVTGVNPIIRVLADVIITGNGMIDSANQGDGYCFIVGSSDGSVAGNLTIENGTFKGTTTAVSVTKGTATILDGDFRVKPYQVDGQDANYNFLLNCIDTNYKDGSAKIIVKGGKFTKFNPADNAAEGANTSFVAPGHMAVDNDDETWNVIGMVAMIGETGFATLAEAIKTAQANDTIKLVANVTENVTINKNITLDGANFNYTGKMNIDAKAVTVQNLNVVGGNIVKGSGTKSGANITIKNCDFDGQMANVYAVELRATNKIVIEDCTAKNYGYGFLQVPKSNNTISVKNVDISDVNYGFKIDYSNGVTLENVNVTDARQIGIYDSNYGKKVYTIKNCKITGKTPIAIWERNTTTYDTFNFVGANDFGTAEFTISNQAILKLADADTVLKGCEGLNVTTDVEGHCVKYIEGAYYVLPDFTVEAIASVNGDATVETAVAGDKITVEVKVTKGGNYTNADWVLKYDPRYVTYDGTDAKNYKISGKVYDGAPNDGYDELNADYALGTYTFTVNELTTEAKAVFEIVDAHVHNYAMAIEFDGVEASKQDDSVAIKFKTADREIDTKTVTYNGMEQRGNSVKNAPANATITYSKTNDFTNGKQLPPAFVNVGTHTYYAQIKLDSYATKVVTGTLIIEAKDVEPSVEWMVAPESDKVEFKPEIKGVVDDTFTGKVTVTGKKADGTEFKYEFDESEFVYNGEGKAIYTGEAKAIDGVKGNEYLEVTVKYTKGADDNYKDGEATKTVYVNKSTIDDVMEDKLEALIVGVGEDIVYDGQTHNVTVDVVELAELGWTADVKAHNGIKNYGDVEVVDVTFTDTTGKYNDYTATVMIKIVRRDVTIYVNNATKKNGQPDSEATVWGYTAITSNGSGEAIIGTDLGEIKIVRANGKTDEVEGSYPITAIYTPNDNYTVKVEDGTLTIFDAVVKIEVVDNAHNGNQLKYQDVMSDYTAGSVANGNKATKMILVHTDADYAFFTYKGEKMYDVTDAEYYYVDHNYDTGIHTTDKQYRHVYAIVVDAEYGDVTTETIEGKYASHIAYAGKDATAAYAPVKVTYDADINDKSELHTNDYSTVKGVYGGIYSNSRYQISILKADYTKDKIVNTADAIAVKNIVIGE